MSDLSRSAALAADFRRFAARECDGISPLYTALARRIAEEPVLL